MNDIITKIIMWKEQIIICILCFIVLKLINV